MVEDWRATYPATAVANSADVPVGIAFDRLPRPPQPFAPNYVFVTGRKVYANGNSTYTIVKYALDGSGGLGTIVAEVEWPPNTGAKAAGRAPVAMAIMDVPTASTTYSGLFVTGVVQTSDGTTNWLTVGYTLDLDLLWTAEFNYQPPDQERFSGSDVPIGIAATAYENNPSLPYDQRVIVTGTSQGNSTGTDMQTVVYDAVDGQEVFRRRFTTAGVADEIPAGASALGYLAWTVCTEPTASGKRLRVFCTNLYDGEPYNPGGLNKWGTPTNPGLVLSLSNHHLDAVGVAVTNNSNNAWIGATATPITPTTEGKNMAFARLPADTPPAQNSAPEVFDSTNHYDDVATCVAVAAVPGITEGNPKHYFCIAGYSVVPGEGRDIAGALYFQQGSSAILERWRASFRRIEHDDDDEAVVATMSGPSSSPPLPGQPVPDLDVFVAGRTKNAAGFWDTLILKYSSNASTPPGSDKPPQWNQQPRAYGNNPGDDVPAGITAYSFYNMGSGTYLHRVFTTIRSFDFSSGSGTNWLTIKHKEVPPP